MKQNQRKNGFILLMVVVMIPLVGMAAVVLTSNSRHIIAQTRRNAVSVHARSAAESGIAWLNIHGPKAVTTNRPVVLQIDHPDKTITCCIEQASQNGQQTIFKVTGRAEDKRFSNEYEEQYILKF